MNKSERREILAALEACRANVEATNPDNYEHDDEAMDLNDALENIEYYLDKIESIIKS